MAPLNDLPAPAARSPKLPGAGIRRRPLAARIRGAYLAGPWVLGLFVAMTVGAAGTAETGEREQLIRGALVYKLGKFAHWPPQAEDRDTFVIGVLRDAAFADLVRRHVEGESLHSLPVAVRGLEDVADARTCHVLFIAPLARSDLDTALATLGRAPVLTIGNQPDFLEAGGMINLAVHNGKLRFSVNLSASQRAGLELDARLLRVAQRVTGAP